MATNVLLPVFLLLAALALPHTGAAGEEEAPSECRPYIEEALKGLKDPVEAEVSDGDEDRFTSQWDEIGKQEKETTKEYDLTDETQSNEEQNELGTIESVASEGGAVVSSEEVPEEDKTAEQEGSSVEEVGSSNHSIGETESSVESQQEEEENLKEVNEENSKESKEADDESKTKSNESEAEKEIDQTSHENEISAEDTEHSEPSQERTLPDETESTEQSGEEIAAHSDTVPENISEGSVGDKETFNEDVGSMEESSIEARAIEGGEITSTEEVGSGEEEVSAGKEPPREGMAPSSVEGAVSEETIVGDPASIESSQNERSDEEASPVSGEAPTSVETPPTTDEAPNASGEAPPTSGEATPTANDEASHASGEASHASDEAPHGSDEATPTSDEAPSASSEATPDGETNHIDEAASNEQDSLAAPNSKSQEEEESSHEATDEHQPDTVDQVISPEEEDLTMNMEIPEKLRPRDHISEILRLDKDSAEIELLLGKTIDITLRDLKRLYESAIKPLEILYKYRDLSNRHFGDPEIFSKPLILFMGPWSGGKSTIINYLLDNEYRKSALRTGAEPSPAYFNIVMWGESEEVLDGTQLAADWTFSGLQKFGQGLLDRLRGLQMNHPLLEKVNIVEIPGILEIRKQVERLFPFNDACQWFIDRADIIFLVYDPSKLDVGPESEAILDQLKGREYQTRIILNKADQVKPEELMRVQGTLIWNISPLMSSTEPPVMYSTSLWSIPYESGAPTRLLFAQEKAFLRDLRDAIDKRVENKIASARRFAVRVRNHAKMVDCYLTTYYNHKTFFGNKKIVSDDIIEHPQNYHIYEGLSTLTNISRYDLPDPEVYKDFFRLNPVYDFQQLSATCTYFKGCPINRLDVAIAYELPELVGKYKKSAEEVLKQFKRSESNS